MRFLLVFLFTLALYSQEIVNKIAIIVNGISITSYDINKTQKELSINKDQAISYLIDQSIFKSLLKKYNVYVDSYDIEKEIFNIAKQNSMNVYQFKQYLTQKKQLQQFLKEIKLKLQKRKLLKYLHVNVSKEEIMDYYEKHKQEYIAPSNIEVTEYSSKNKNSLVKVIKNPLANIFDVNVRNLNLETNSTNPCLIDFLEKFPEKSFSTIFKSDSNYMVFYIVSKGEAKPKPLKLLVDKIYQKLMEQKANKALQDLLAKERAKANIKFMK